VSRTVRRKNCHKEYQHLAWWSPIETIPRRRAKFHSDAPNETFNAPCFYRRWLNRRLRLRNSQLLLRSLARGEEFVATPFKHNANWIYF